MTMNTGNWGKALVPGIQAWYGNAYAEYPEEHKDLFDISTSRRHHEEDVSVARLGLAAEVGEGAPVLIDDEKQGFIQRYTHTKFGLGFVITEELVEDDLYDVVGKRRAESLAFSMRQTKEVVAANVYNRATNASYTFADGVAMLSTANLYEKGGSFANKPTTDIDLSEAAIEQACIDIAKFKDAAGNQISVMPQSLVIPVDSMFVAHRILGSDYRPGTANNDINVLKTMSKFPKGIKVNHYLTDTDAWFIRTNCPNGLKMIIRKAEQLKMDTDVQTGNLIVVSTMRFSVGITDKRAIYGSVGA